ncbi:hypothetical protein MKW94_026340, partial [Papaver nudicaule]|nr:hypothetical protein [Papaver nudicaule]
MLSHIMYAEFAREAWDWLAEAGAWTDLEKENYNQMLATAATAREHSDDIPEVDKVLTRRNYRKWVIYVKNVLLSKYLWAVVDGSATVGSRSYKTKNHHALVTIRMSCGEEMFLEIDEESDARKAWCKLEGKLGAATTAFVVDSNKIKAEINECLTVIVDEGSSTLRSNYITWEISTKTYLIKQGLWGFLEETEISDHVKDENALDVIKVSCAPEMRAYILYTDCSKTAWEKLSAASTGTTVDDHIAHCMRVKEAEEIRADLNNHPEADKVLTHSNYLMWEEYVTMLLQSRLLDEVVNVDTKNEIKEACGIRIIKEACGREMMPYIFRSKSPREALASLKKTSHQEKDEYMKYSRLLHAVQKNKFQEQLTDRNGVMWRGAHKFFRDFPEALAAEITKDGSTALHVAVRLGRVDFVRELLKLMNQAQSELKTHQDDTAIAVAARGNNMEIVQMLVKSNPRLPLIGNEQGLHAVTIAAINGNETIMHYLYPNTEKTTEPWGAKSVASLLTSAARLGAFDIVLDLLDHFRHYAVLEKDVYGMTLLSVLAEQPCAFPSGNQFGLLEGWIYRLVPGVKKVLDSKKKQDESAKILQHICSQLPNLHTDQEIKDSLIYEAIQKSVIHGTIEVLEALIDSNPYLEYFKDDDGRGLFQIAIMHRKENIFHYISQLGPRNNQDMLDESGNNALHCAALWDPSSKIVHGPALQIQREIQWFQ